MSETQLEPETEEVDVHHDSEIADVRIQAIHELAMALPQLEKDMDAIQRFAIRRSLPGDWIAFKDRGGEDKVELGFAGALRVARDFGISWIEWKHWKEEGSDEKGRWYTHWYECVTLYRGRRLEMIQGRAGTRDEFFGIEHKAQKDIAEINEGDIKTAARHSCMAEGVKVALGLHRMPKKAILEMGLDASKIKEVSFETRGKALGAEQKTVDPKTGMIQRQIVVKKMERFTGMAKSTGKPWIRWDVWDEDGVKYAMFIGNDDSKRLLLLEDAYEQKVPVKIDIQVNKNEHGENYQIIRVNNEVDANGH